MMLQVLQILQIALSPTLSPSEPGGGTRSPFPLARLLLLIGSFRGDFRMPIDTGYQGETTKYQGCQG